MEGEGEEKGTKDCLLQLAFPQRPWKNRGERKKRLVDGTDVQKMLLGDQSDGVESRRNWWLERMVER